MEGRIAINDLDMISVINLVQRRKRRYLAILLNEIEEIMNDSKLSKEDQFSLVRKAVLDNVNELERAFLRDIFSGDVEGSGIF